MSKYVHDDAVREYLHTVNRVPELRVDGTRNFDVKLFGQPCFDVLPLEKLPELVALGAPYSPIPGENESEDEEADSASSSESESEDEDEDAASTSEVIRSSTRDEQNAARAAARLRARGSRSPTAAQPSEDAEADSASSSKDEELEFDVEEVLATRFDNGVLEYFVKWQNCPPEENFWEPFGVEDHQYCAKVRDFVFRHRRVRRRTDDEAL